MNVQEQLEQRRALSQAMRADQFSVRAFDAQGALTPERCAAIARMVGEFGAVHVQNTGLTDVESLKPHMAALGFGDDARFSAGGRTSAAHQPKWVTEGIRRMDHYPADLYLLPNNEVQYQRFGPERVLFFCQLPPTEGGRTFVHRAQEVEARLRAAGPLGESMLAKFAEHGLMIETGFLDARHPRKHENYFQSWQERYGTDDPDEAIARARTRTDEVDLCWWKPEGRSNDGVPVMTLMTRIVLSAFKRDPSGARHLRFPRLALGPPALENGHRRYPLGNGEPLSEAEEALLMEVYLATRQGVAWERGDLVVFDNVRYGHSRESFSEAREVYVGMAGVVWDDAVAPEPPPMPAPAPPPRRANRGPERSPLYAPSPAAELIAEPLTTRVFDARGELTLERCAAIRAEFARHGALHVCNTGLRCDRAAELPDEVLDWLGFGPTELFAWGGSSSGRTTRRAINKTLRATDDYPPELYLLPHNEILYQRQMPERILFFSARTLDPATGGRTLVHCAARFEDHVRRSGPVGQNLLADLREHGFLIEMGFLDANHPRKHENYFRSWQDRFDTADRDLALARCREATDQFDDCWWRQEPEPAADGAPTFTLMTRICIPAYKHDPRTGRDTLFFPRIALDAPSLQNGHRCFPKGNGDPWTPDEIDVLLDAFLATREGRHYRAGDILLCDNIRYGHSREPFVGPREIGVAMAGRFWTDDAL